MPKATVSIGEVARSLGVSVSQVRELTRRGILSATVTEGGHRRYELSRAHHEWNRFRLAPSLDDAAEILFSETLTLKDLAEDLVWAQIRLLLFSANEPAESINTRRILGYSFTEMLNNAIDHSGGKRVTVVVSQSPQEISISIADDGVGALQHLVSELKLPDLFAAIQELSKGKATTAPARHTGEGIFFTSKAVDVFELSANGLVWLVDNRLRDTTIRAGSISQGTRIALKVERDTQRELVTVFDEFTQDQVFARTRPAIKLFEIGTEFVSRSEAKRLALRLDEFVEVELDFTGVESVGQGFVDELFRVWAAGHTDTTLIPTNMVPAVEFMVRRGLG